MKISAVIGAGGGGGTRYGQSGSYGGNQGSPGLQTTVTITNPYSDTVAYQFSAPGGGGGGAGTPGSRAGLSGGSGGGTGGRMGSTGDPYIGGIADDPAFGSNGGVSSCAGGGGGGAGSSGSQGGGPGEGQYGGVGTYFGISDGGITFYGGGGGGGMGIDYFRYYDGRWDGTWAGSGGAGGGGEGGGWLWGSNAVYSYHYNGYGGYYYAFDGYSWPRSRDPGAGGEATGGGGGGGGTLRYSYDGGYGHGIETYYGSAGAAGGSGSVVLIINSKDISKSISTSGGAVAGIVRDAEIGSVGAEPVTEYKFTRTGNIQF